MTLVQLIIAALMALGLLNSPAEWDTLSAEKKAELKEIVIDDLDGY